VGVYCLYFTGHDLMVCRRVEGTETSGFIRVGSIWTSSVSEKVEWISAAISHSLEFTNLRHSFTQEI
jgi:hypothetical protein